MKALNVANGLTTAPVPVMREMKNASIENIKSEQSGVELFKDAVN